MLNNESTPFMVRGDITKNNEKVFEVEAKKQKDLCSKIQERILGIGFTNCVARFVDYSKGDKKPDLALTLEVFFIKETKGYRREGSHFKEPILLQGKELEQILEKIILPSISEILGQEFGFYISED